MKVEHYTRGAEIKAEARIKYPIPIGISGKKVLIVDDITDTGDTLSLSVAYAQSLNPAEVRTAVLQHKTCSSFTPDFYAQKIVRWRWIIYPWARYEDLGGFAEKILGDRTLEITRIITEFKVRYEIMVGEKELLEILQGLAEMNEIERVETEKMVGWRVKGK
ncbi:Xanthine-guanine phosphoribosyltransferase [Methanosarcina siciliae C2J]|uniref:Xanthine-guanine phosphoribosyltransferase n=4 Tax=Methanosarcina siciliae TaxID=38027 RepID=A0A0E3LBB4_9EURY|nr:Xanthine-guanine phosphoribosyltransferase [Methanosarcina siciliae T4/M]AKB33476.1 Xanthine-guanine phosphoribosyltransferase [Methanosarcina siciliae HI350]AKB35784.1 Xanthine-guanine phosphoribosyltransferase [Methanosarcina siciliae C2J]